MTTDEKIIKTKVGHQAISVSDKPGGSDEVSAITAQCYIVLKS
jgi:hypothetical protein